MNTPQWAAVAHMATRRGDVLFHVLEDHQEYRWKDRNSAGPYPRNHAARPGEFRTHERVVEMFQDPSFEIEVPQIIIHKADQPDIVVNFRDADCLAGKDGAS